MKQGILAEMVDSRVGGNENTRCILWRLKKSEKDTKKGWELVRGNRCFDLKELPIAKVRII